jgi:hypothetical protein
VEEKINRQFRIVNASHCLPLLSRITSSFHSSFIRFGYLIKPKAFHQIASHFLVWIGSSFHTLPSASAISLYPKPITDSQCFALPSALVSVNPKPFIKSLRSLLAFLLLVILHKRACDAALNQKSLSLS